MGVEGGEGVPGLAFVACACGCPGVGVEDDDCDDWLIDCTESLNDRLTDLRVGIES